MERTNEELDRLLAVFRRGTLEDFFTIHTVLEREGVSVEQLKGYLNWKAEEVNKSAFAIKSANDKVIAEAKEKAKERAAEWDRLVRKCPLCNSPLRLSRISEPEGPANKEGWRSLWFCGNDGCLFEEYSKEFTDKLHAEVMEGKYANN